MPSSLEKEVEFLGCEVPYCKIGFLPGPIGNKSSFLLVINLQTETPKGIYGLFRDEGLDSDIEPAQRRADSLADYGGVGTDELLKMYRVMVLARRIELEEKLLLRRGLCRFFIGCGGKELIDVAAAHLLRSDDPFIGYYRNKAFDVYRCVSIKEKMYEAVGDRRGAATGGMLQPAHSSYPDLAIMPQASPTGSHALEAAGLGEAIKNPSPITGPIGVQGGRFKPDAIVYCSIGEGVTSSSEFHRAVFYSVYNNTKNIFAIYKCGWATSTSVGEQFPEGNPITSFEGFQRFGY